MAGKGRDRASTGQGHTRDEERPAPIYAVPVVEYAGMSNAAIEAHATRARAQRAGGQLAGATHAATDARRLLERLHGVDLPTYRAAVDELDAGAADHAWNLIRAVIRNAVKRCADAKQLATAVVSPTGAERTDQDELLRTIAGIELALMQFGTYHAPKLGPSYFRGQWIEGAHGDGDPDAMAALDAEAGVPALLRALDRIRDLLGSDPEQASGEARYRAAAEIERAGNTPARARFIHHVLAAAGHATALAETRGPSGKRTAQARAELFDVGPFPTTVAGVFERLAAARAAFLDESYEHCEGILRRIRAGLVEMLDDERTVGRFTSGHFVRLARGAPQTIDHLLRRVKLRAGGPGRGPLWDHDTAPLVQARDALEVLAGEKGYGESQLDDMDDADVTAVKLQAGFIAGSMLAAATGGAVVAEAPLLAETARVGGTWALGNPIAARQLAFLGGGTAMSVIEAGGIDEWWQQTSTPMGAASFALDLLGAAEGSGMFDGPTPGRRPRPPIAGQPNADDAVLRGRLRHLKRVDDPARVAESNQDDASFRQRRADNQKLRDDPDRLAADLERAGVPEERYEQMLHGDPARKGQRLPLGFRDHDQLDQFKGELATTIASIRVDGEPITAQVRQIGTGTQFYSGNPKKPLGHHWDRNKPVLGDLDIEVTSPELARHMLRHPDVAVNDRVLVGGERVLFKSGGPDSPGSFYEQFPEFGRLAHKWSETLGREVDIKLKMDLDPPSAPSGDAGPIVLYGGKQ